MSISRLDEMFETAIDMLKDARASFDREDAKMARQVFQKDERLDAINRETNGVIESFIKSHNGEIAHALHVISSVRKLERTGDQVKNVAEEIIFYLEAKVLKHITHS